MTKKLNKKFFSGIWNTTQDLEDPTFAKIV